MPDRYGGVALERCSATVLKCCSMTALGVAFENGRSRKRWSGHGPISGSARSGDVDREQVELLCAHLPAPLSPSCEARSRIRLDEER